MTTPADGRLEADVQAIQTVREAHMYITIYQRPPGGAWRIARDIWNTDTALPGMRERSPILS